MHNLYVRDVICYCDGKLLNGDVNQVLGSVCTDSRKVKRGDVYIALKGENFDGNNYYKEAISKGASCLILSREIEDKDFDNVTVIFVDDTLDCLQRLASYKRSLYDIPVIAVTGSVGKTSTKDIIYSVVSKKYKTYKTIGNYNNHLGVPLTILGLEDHEALVVEMGMNHLEEISLLSKIAKPTIAVITNIGTAHIGNLGSRENILKAKMEILDGMIGNCVVLNNDDDLLYNAGLDIGDKYEIYTCSVDNDSKYKAVNIKEDVFESKFDILNMDKDISVSIGGRAFIYNSLVAYAVGNILDIDKDKIKDGIREFKLTSHRLERKVNGNGVVIIDDTYNANFDSMKSSLELLGRVCDKRKIAIVGDMLELGDYTKDLHCKIGDIIVDNHIDILITVGKYSRCVSERALELGYNVEHVYMFDKEEDIKIDFCMSFGDEDIILVKGSHSMNLVRVVDRLMSL